MLWERHEPLLPRFAARPIQVDQGVVLLGVHHMKGSVTRGLLTKDVRSADGWQIGMDVFEQYVQVRSFHQLHSVTYSAYFTVLSLVPSCHVDRLHHRHWIGLDWIVRVSVLRRV